MSEHTIDKIAYNLLLLDNLWNTLISNTEKDNYKLIEEEVVKISLISDLIYDLLTKEITKETIKSLSELFFEYINSSFDFELEGKITEIIKNSLNNFSLEYNVSLNIEQFNVKKSEVLIISDSEHLVNEISLHAKYFGFDYKQILNPQSIIFISNSQEHPSVIIIDLDATKKWDIPLIEITKLLQKNKTNSLHTTKIIGVSNNVDFRLRLEAVRANIEYIFTNPVNIQRLMDKIDNFFSILKEDNLYRVLIVEDSETSIRFAKRSLEAEGMIVETVKEPIEVLDKVVEFNPDLILMDMYLPDCDGIELSKIIRQHESFTGTPIVFLSSEKDLKKQLLAMQIGADDFLTKPITSEHLVTSLSNRIKRHKILSSFIKNDSLTGLLNHTQLKRGLDLTIDRATRNNIPISFVMLDIDHFKKVNDSYGHIVGDRVIKVLARLLKNRLRKTDLIGRYGGEEFAIVLWGANEEQAKEIIDNLREDFRQIEHSDENGNNFTVTFSAGIALHKENLVLDVSQAADKALYISKHNGRNQVTVFNNELNNLL